MESNELRTGNIVNFLNGSSWLQGYVKSIGESKSVIDSWVVKNKNLQGIKILKLGYVHQLQNLYFALFAKELNQIEK
ncbi:hypothetical protein BFS30_03365 [Pedobacter steynii]|uniref:Uncharacterized protein n=1 Tax=Pedobacter steynii TaxID=430522 RepID=A0A1D7QC54_9SPHI|nr:hypothetical protein BFS30_03365 [Pedobacter steynii]